MAAELDNVKIYYSGGLSSYQCVQNPKFNINFRETKYLKMVDGGVIKIYHKNIVVSIDLYWEEPAFFRYDQFNSLRTIFNTQDELIINLSPVSCPAASFTVNWTSDFTFYPVEGVTPFGWTGLIHLDGAAELSEVPDITWARDGAPDGQ